MGKKELSPEIKEKINKSHFLKFGGNAPEGFIMIPEKTLERLKDFDFWKKWKYEPNILIEKAIEDTKENF